MASWQCPNCLLVNGDEQRACRRCQTEPGVVAQTSAGSDPGHDKRASPDGLWREGRLLVMHKNASLPNRCLKCNSPSNGLSISRTFRKVDSTFGWMRYIPYLRYVYWIARAASNDTTAVNLRVCQTHYSQVHMVVNIANLLRFLGLGLLVYGLYLGSLLWLAGLTVAVIGSGLASAYSIVKMSRMDDYYIWLGGVDANYLASLPPVPK